MKIGRLTLEQQQDVRSLAMFRILAGIYLIYDIFSRLQHGRFSLLWYTSTSTTEGGSSSSISFLHPEDTPHKSPIHRIWFYRGSESFQITMFTITFLLALSFTLGYKCNTLSKTLLWINVVAMQCRCMPQHDGSDTFIRHLLLWCIQLPVSRVWSVDSAAAAKHGSEMEKKDFNYCSITNRTAVWGIRLQIVFMYLGTVLHRTTDRHGIFELYKSKWLPPQLTAVHYALNNCFATRKCWLGDLVRTNLPMSQVMTFMAMVMETFAPLCCLLMGGTNYTHIPAFVLFQLHLGLLILINLPNWQFVGMITSVVWLPSWIWDELQRRLSLTFPNYVAPPQVPLSVTCMQKKDILSPTANTNEKDCDGRRRETTNVDDDVSRNTKQRHYRRPLPWLTYFFVTYMCLDFMGNRQWIRKIDDGDIGEFLRFSQYWVMYSEPPTRSSRVMILGTMTMNHKEYNNINVWEWIKTGNTNDIVDMDAFEKDIWTNMTHVYPSARIERIFSMWPNDEKLKNARTMHFLDNLCDYTPFSHIRIIGQTLNVMPPGSDKRFSRIYPDRVVDSKC